MTDHDLASQSSWDTLVRLPLARCTESGRIHIIVDGLDQPQSGARELILAQLHSMTSTAPVAELGHVRIIAGVRSGENIDTRTELAHAHRIEVSAPGGDEMASAVNPSASVVTTALWANSVGEGVPGGWLVARLSREIAGSRGELTPFTDLGKLVAARIEVSRLGVGGSDVAMHALNVIAAAGFGPLLPIALLAAAVAGTDEPPPLGQIRDTVVTFGALISRGNPGTDQETLGISHHALLRPVADYIRERGLDPAAAHQAIIDACELSAGRGDRGNELADDELASYWATAGPRHYLGAGSPSAAIRFLRQHETPRAADNRDRWSSWLPAITSALGADHPDAVAALQTLADWRGEAGDAARAFGEMQALVANAAAALGPDHVVVLSCRQSMARWQGAAGDAPGAAAEAEQLVADAQRVLGPDHLETLTARREHAFWRGTAGHPNDAAAEMEQLLPDVVRALGDDHRETLAAKFMVAYWRGEAGDALGAVAALEQVLAHQVRVLGPDHPDTFGVRGTLAYWRGESGDPGVAAEETAQLLADRVRVLGRDHPRTLATRHNLALWRGEAGDPEGAAADFAELLADERRVLGPDHPYALSTCLMLAIRQGEAGDPAGAAAATAQLLADRVRVLGSEHPDTLATRHNLAVWQGEAGDVTTAVDEFEKLLADYIRVMGPLHRDTLATQRDLELWRSVTAHSEELPRPDQLDLGHWRRRTSL
jgi:hypothetical protein